MRKGRDKMKSKNSTGTTDRTGNHPGFNHYVSTTQDSQGSGTDRFMKTTSRLESIKNMIDKNFPSQQFNLNFAGSPMTPPINEQNFTNRINEDGYKTHTARANSFMSSHRNMLNNQRSPRLGIVSETDNFSP